MELTNSTLKHIPFYYQIDYTLQSELTEYTGYLHVAFRRENPTVMKQDFVIAENLKGPGRFLGCAIGIRVLPSDFAWYGEGEVKFYLDEDRDYPTICGTGLEDYIGSAWGLGAHNGHFAGAPLVVKDPESRNPNPDYVGFYRWHIPDPIIFRERIKVTIQQIGAVTILKSQEKKLEEIEKKHPVAGQGWNVVKGDIVHAWGIAERIDDYCAAAFVYCRTPQGVPRLDLDLALADIDRLEYEEANPMEMMLGAV